jgi:hypothetical protein
VTIGATPPATAGSNLMVFRVEVGAGLGGEEERTGTVLGGALGSAQGFRSALGYGTTVCVAAGPNLGDGAPAGTVVRAPVGAAVRATVGATLRYGETDEGVP